MQNGLAVFCVDDSNFADKSPGFPVFRMLLPFRRMKFY